MQNFDFKWMNDANSKLWHTVALGELKNAAMVDNSETNPYCDVAIAAMTAFKADSPDLDDGCEFAQLIMEFRDFLSRWQGLTGLGEIEGITVSVSGEVDTLDGRRTLIVQAIVRSEGNATLALKYISGLLNDALVRSGKPVKEGDRLAPQHVPGTPSPTGVIEEWDSELIAINLNNDKKQARVFGGRWMKYGVPIFPEVLKTLGLDLDKLPAGQYPGKYHAVCQMGQDGKPQKVTAIRKD